MKIQKYKKIGKSKYKIILDNSELTLYEDVIIKNNLLTKKNLNLEELNLILEENKYYEVYNIALNYIGIKMRNKYELQKYLEKKSFDTSLIKKVIDKLSDEGYLNEHTYIKAFINDKINLSTDGPYKIKQNLLNFNIDEGTIDNYINEVDESIWKEKIEKIIAKRKKSSTKLSAYMFFNKTKLYLYNLGYPQNLIEDILSNTTFENKNLENDYNKAITKYKKKYTNEKLEYYIRNYLYQKGYTIEEINSIINP